jgi:hypothetical protein
MAVRTPLRPARRRPVITTGRWHPSRSTDEDKRRLREWSEDVHRWMFRDIFALIHELDGLERRHPEHPNVRVMNMVLIRRLEKPHTTRRI